MVPSCKELKQSWITQKGSSLSIAPETWTMATRSCRPTREPWTISPWYLRYFVALTVLDSTTTLHIPVGKKPRDSVWFNQPVLPALLKHSLATSLLSEFRSHVIFPQLEIRNIEDMIKCLTFPIRALWHEFASFSLESAFIVGKHSVTMCFLPDDLGSASCPCLWGEITCSCHRHMKKEYTPKHTYYLHFFFLKVLFFKIL